MDLCCIISLVLGSEENMADDGSDFALDHHYDDDDDSSTTETFMVKSKFTPTDLEILRTLPVVDLSRNRIGNQAATVLLEAFLHTKNVLQELNLANNDIDGEKDGAVPLAGRLGSFLTKSKSLQRLDLSGSWCGGPIMAALVKALQRNSTLRELTLQRICWQRHAPSSYDLIKIVIAKESSIRMLDLSHNESFGDIGAFALAKVLPNNRCLESLKLRCCGIDTDGAVVLADALRSNTCLKKEHATVPVDELIKVFESQTSSLQELMLRHYKLKGDVCALAKALGSNRILRSLHLTRVPYDGVFALFEALAQNTTLQELELHISCIKKECLSFLSNTSLQKLALSRHWGTLKVTDLMVALKHSKLQQLRYIDNKDGTVERMMISQGNLETLKVLDLSGSRTNDEGAVRLAGVLKENSTLHTLRLAHDEIGDAGAKALAEALKTNNALRKLDLEGNTIGGAGVAAFAGALYVNCTLRELYLQDNLVSIDGTTAMAEALSTNSSLEELGLSLVEEFDDKGKTYEVDAECCAVDQSGVVVMEKAIRNSNWTLRKFFSSSDHEEFSRLLAPHKRLERRRRLGGPG
eukprot:Nitzschia sp. Nitz4//scaffold125_size66327//52148//53992//NITZ4_006138-RA/size66327-processed-gene-0.20-mRNA-1//1//CDS//3329534634//4232//frame0